MDLAIGSNPEALQAEIDRLRGLLDRKTRGGDIEFLGESMPRNLLKELSTGKQLTTLFVANASCPAGRKTMVYHDGGGLWLQVSAAGARSWIFRYRATPAEGAAPKQRELGLGSLKDVTLAEARGRAAICRRLVREGVDVIERKRGTAGARAAEAAAQITFERACEKYIAAHKAGWRSPKHEPQLKAALKRYVYPIIGKLPVSSIATPHIMNVMEQADDGGDSLWVAKGETADRLRRSIKAVLDWARVRGYRDGENPARWDGHLQYQLPRQSKVSKVEHHAALPYADMFDFWSSLCARGGVSTECLKFVILTAARSGEALGARWSEIDISNKLWTVPAGRMKSGKEHRVPLSDAAVKILQDLEPLKQDAESFVFPGQKRGAPLSSMALLMLLRKMKREDITAHGFRSTFRDWAAETTSYANEVVEMALAHSVGSKVEAAYRRGDMFERRRKLMDDWAAWCATQPNGGDNQPQVRAVQNG